MGVQLSRSHRVSRRSSDPNLSSDMADGVATGGDEDSEQPMARGRRVRHSREEINPKIVRPAPQTPADLSDSSQLCSIEEHFELGPRLKEPTSPEHEDVAPNPRGANAPGTAEMGVARGRRERPSREEFNIKLARPPARAS